MNVQKKLSLNFISVFFALLGFVLGPLDFSIVNEFSKTYSDFFIGLLKLISLPLVFFSLLSSLGSYRDSKQLKNVGFKVIKYTLLTTFVSACIALVLYLMISPARNSGLSLSLPTNTGGQLSHHKSYWSFILGSIPTNFIEPFIKNNVLGVLFLALFISLSLVQLPFEKKEYVILFVNDIFALLLKMASMIMYLMPLAITSFIILFYQDLKLGMNIKNLYLYILCIVGANIVQAVIILPLLLLYKKINPWTLFRTMTPALTLAFFSKSSAATLPLAIKCSERFPMRPKIASFTFSICSTINMNACAGFILITVLFNSEIYGLDFSVYSYMSWIFIATIAAIGNAAVPMGCYFLASSFLASQNIPLKIMGVILPLYSILDMLETAINIWSDSCVSAIVNKETSHEYS